MKVATANSSHIRSTVSSEIRGAIAVEGEIDESDDTRDRIVLPTHRT
jgi:hypothetical protein